MPAPHEPSTLNPQPVASNPQPSKPAGQEVIRRQVHLDQTLDQLWRLVGSRDQLSNWLVDEFNVDLTVGSVGEVSDEGRRRHVHVDAFSPLERLAFTWWDDHEGSVASQVEIDVEGCADGTSTLRITETLLASAHHSRTPTDDTTLEASAATLAWEVRMVSLWACTVAMALVQ